MNALNKTLSLLPFKINLTSLMYAIVIDTVIYFITIWAIVYLSHRYEVHHIRKPIIAAYTIFSIIFVSVFKFLLLSLAFTGITYIMCLYF